MVIVLVIVTVIVIVIVIVLDEFLQGVEFFQGLGLVWSFGLLRLKSSQARYVS